MQVGYFKFNNDKLLQDELVGKIFAIYSQIKDMQSKKIFLNSLMYSLTYDVCFLHDNVMLSNVGKQFDEKLDAIGTKKIYVYGAGERGRRLVQMFPDKNWGGFIDKKKRGFCEELPILGIDEFNYEREYSIIISVLNNYLEVKELLRQNGCKEQDIIVLEEWNMDIRKEQYIEERCLENTVINGDVVDAGAFDGKDVLKLFEKFKVKNGTRAWVFEPDSRQMNECKYNLMHLDNIMFCEQGISDCEGIKKMVADIGGLSQISEEGNEDVEIVTLDDVLRERQVSLIKMDIEGFEMAALEGAKRIIKTQKPILEISVYHKREDIWEIPHKLLELNPKYQFAFGHYSIGQVDTVLYAF